MDWIQLTQGTVQGLFTCGNETNCSIEAKKSVDQQLTKYQYNNFSKERPAPPSYFSIKISMEPKHHAMTIQKAWRQSSLHSLSAHYLWIVRFTLLWARKRRTCSISNGWIPVALILKCNSADGMIVTLYLTHEASLGGSLNTCGR